MKKIKNYVLSSIMVLTPALLLAHPGHEHQGTIVELIFHFLVTSFLALGIAAGMFYLVKYYHRKKNRINSQTRLP